MDKNDFFNLKFFSNIYLKLKEKRVTSLEMNLNALNKEIEAEKKSLQQNNEYLNKLTEENTQIKKEYLNLMKLFENENKTISSKNNNYNISIWENVYIRKDLSYYVIQTKKGENIYTFDKSMNDFVEYFSTLDYSIIVLSISIKRITLQFRIKESSPTKNNF